MSVAVATIVGQPATGTVTFLTDAQNPSSVYDPPVVVLSSVSPFGNTVPFTYAVDTPPITRVSEGVYALLFVPTTDGDWLVIGDAFQEDGVTSIGAGISAALSISPRRGGTPQQIAAQSIVEQYIKRPLAIVTETIELYSYEEGILELPRGPVISVGSVLSQLGTAGFLVEGDEDMGYEGSLVTDSEDIPPSIPVVPTPTADAAGRIADPNVIGFTWYSVTYTHGWSDAGVPQIIRTVMAAIAARLTANPDAVLSERIGSGYAVTYASGAQAPSPAWLTDDEKTALAQFRPNRVGTLITSTPIGGLP